MDESSDSAQGQHTAKARRREPAAGGDFTVLVIEDEQDLQDLLRFNLTREGYRVLVADSAEQGMKLLRQTPPHIVVLDLMLPGMDGLDFCRLLRQDEVSSRVPILMLTAKGEESDVVTGLEAGADDYLAKPFSPRVLLARVKAILRRRQSGDDAKKGEPRSNIITVRTMTIDPERHEVRISGSCVELTATEFKMLSLLAARPGRVFTRQQIIATIHGQYAAVTDRSVDVQIVTLRRKLGEYGTDIETVRGVGYRFKSGSD